jgi:hypothetical protein
LKIISSTSFAGLSEKAVTFLYSTLVWSGIM